MEPGRHSRKDAGDGAGAVDRTGADGVETMDKERIVKKGILLWLLGVPIGLIVVLKIFGII